MILVIKLTHACLLDRSLQADHRRLSSLRSRFSLLLFARTLCIKEAVGHRLFFFVLIEFCLAFLASRISRNVSSCGVESL